MIARNEAGNVIGMNMHPDPAAAPDSDFWQLYVNALAYASDPEVFA